MDDRDEEAVAAEHWNRIVVGRTPAPERRGDLADDLQLQDEDGFGYESLFTPDDPIGAPRFTLNRH